MTRKLLTIVGVSVVAIWLLGTSLFTVDETEVGVVTRFGEPLEHIRAPGLQAKLPWPIDRVIRIDRRKLMLKSEPQEILTDDEKNVVVEAFLVWRVMNPVKFVATVRNRAGAEERLRDLYAARQGATVGTLAMEDFVSVGIDRVQFHTVAQGIQHEINNIAEEFYGIEVVALQVSGFTLPPENRASVIGRMNAERGRIAARYRSEGAEESLKVEAKAAAEHERILAEAHARATRILGEGEAKALGILGEAYAKDPEFYRFVRSLESYQAIIGKDTTLFIESDSKLFRVLNGE